MFAGGLWSEVATFALATHPAPRLSSPAGFPDDTHRKDSPAAHEPRRTAPDPGRSAMALDASHAQGRDFHSAGSQNPRRQKGHRSHRHGPMANPRPGGRPLGLGGRLGSLGGPG